MAPWDWLTRVITPGAFILVGVGTYDLLFRNELEMWFALAIVSPVWIVFGLTYLFAPRGFRVSPAGVVIRRPIGPIVIPHADIGAAEVVERVKPGFRLFGSGGLFGWIGLFTIQGGGSAKVYATRWDRMVRVKTRQETYLLSPANPEAFLEAVRFHRS
jgi:hypothetical protein